MMPKNRDEFRRSESPAVETGNSDSFADRLAAIDEIIAEEGPESDAVSMQIAEDDDLRSAASALRLLERFRKSTQRGNAAVGASDENGRSDFVNRPAEPAPIAADDQTDLPSTIGRFQIQKRLGHGGYGIVFLAFDPKLKRQVAIKVPRLQTLITPEMHGRFLREGEMAAALDHPGIVSVFECGNSGPLWYLVSAYCEGIALDEWLQKRREPVADRTAAKMVCGLADAIHHAHSRGVLHRDLKPANVLLELKNPDSCSVEDVGDACRITDFGLAKVISSLETDVTGSTAGDIIGTPAYMSPEQADGRLNEIGVGSDIYGLGCLLYELLTGGPPFMAESMLAVLEAVRTRAPSPPTKLKGSVSVDLSAICMKCLEKSPRDRYESAAHLRDDVIRFLNHEPVIARPIAATERIRRWIRRNPILSGLSSVVVLLLVALIAGSTTAAILLSRAQDETLNSLEAEIIAKDDATRKEGQAILALYEARLALAAASRNSGLPGQRFKSLDAVRDAGRLTARLQLGEPDRLRRRNEAIAAMALVDLRLDRDWSGLPPRTADSQIGIDSQVARYARLEPDGRIAIRDMNDNRKLTSFPGLGTLEERPWTLFSPSGRYLAVRGKNEASHVRVQLWNLDEQETPVVDFVSQHWTPHRDIAFNHDETAFAYCRDANTIAVFNLTTMKTARQFEVAGFPAWMKFSPDGTVLATSLMNQQSRVIFIDVESGDMAGVSCDHPHDVSDIAWSHNRQLMAMACHDRNVHVWDAMTRQRLCVCRGHRHVVNGVAFAHHSEMLMSTAWDMTTRLWEPLTGRQLLRTNGRAGAFSDDDRWLGMAFAGVSIGRWEVASRREFFMLPGNGDVSFPFDMDYSSDGRFLAVAGQTAGAIVWDMRTGRKLAALPRECASVRFSEDDSSLFVGGRGSGILQWPFDFRSDDAELRIGPEQLRFTTRYGKASLSLNQACTNAIINTTWDQAVLWDLKNADTILTLHSPDIRYHDISADGRWAAAGNWRGDGVKIWDARSGQLVAELPVDGSVRVRFSPDGLWLLTCSYDAHSLWKVGSWQQTHHMKHDGFSYRIGAVSDDSRLAAVTLRSGVLLLDLSTGKELARLTTPEQLTAKTVALSPDGRQLALGTQEGMICVWQLDQLRRKLAEMDLDWSQPAHDATADHVESVRSTVVLQPFSSSSEFSSEFAVGLAFDGDPDTRWNSARGDGAGAWIARLWDEPQAIGHITIHQAFDRIAGFRIQQLSPDHGSWTDVMRFDGDEFAGVHQGKELADSRDETVNPVFTISLPQSIRTRGIRILVTGATNTISIRDIEFQ